MIILAIETSCDETAAAVVEVKENEKIPQFNVLSNIVSSQAKLHSQFGGVIPNLAAREHAKNIVPVLKEALNKAYARQENINLIAATRGPGLIPALLVGTSAAKALSYAWKKPLIGVNHIEGHILANFINNPTIEFPALCLVVSGGHTELVLMRGHKNFEIIGKTRDDAAGEAFDKAARLLNLGYPGGPAISQAAEQGSAGAYSLPRPMIKTDNFDFSFSGLKTAVRGLVKEDCPCGAASFDIAAEFQQAAIDVLIYKTIKAAEKYQPKTIMLAGGVAANKELREQMEKILSKSQFLKESKNSSLHCAPFRMIMPELEYCADNAAMIATAGYFHREEATDKPWDMETDANIVIAENVKIR